MFHSSRGSVYVAGSEQEDKKEDDRKKERKRKVSLSPVERMTIEKKWY